MEKYKLENFKGKYNNKKLGFVALSNYEIYALIKRFKDELSIEIELTLTSLWEGLESTSLSVGSTEDLSDIFKCLSINATSSDNVHVIWKFDDEIDLFQYSEIMKYWGDIWYDVSDELVLLYTQGFFILISDWGEIRYTSIFNGNGG